MGFVVEGTNDQKKVLAVLPNAFCVVTNGTRMNGRVKMDVKEALSVCDQVLLLTDPDEAGDQLSEMVLRQFPFLERVSLNTEACVCYRNHKRKVGVEHCEDEYLMSVFNHYLEME